MWMMRDISGYIPKMFSKMKERKKWFDSQLTARMKNKVVGDNLCI